MHSEKLAKLRALAEKTDFNDQAMNQFVKQAPAFAGDQADQVAPYAGYSTFLKSPQISHFGDVDIALAGVPYDLGVTNRPGARFGPQQVRELSTMASGPKHHASGIIPGLLARFGDVGDVPITSTYDIEKANAEIAAWYHRLVDAGARPLSVGGDHSITYPILQAVGRDEPVALVHIDAHADTGGPFNGSRFHHGGPFRNAALDGLIDPEKTIQIGIRGRAEPHWDFSYDSGMRVVHIEEFYDMGIDAVIAEIHRIVGESPVYISFDVDSIDPAYTPGTGTPETGGMTPRDVQALIRGCQGLNIVGGDVVEVSPPYDQSGNTALVAATMLWEILCIMAATKRD